LERLLKGREHNRGNTIFSFSFPVEFLVTQLTELVRMAFIAGTSTNDLLKLEGMKTLQVCFTVYTHLS